jgi:cell division protein FtsB
MWYLLAVIIWGIGACGVWYPIQKRVKFANENVVNKVIRAILILFTWWLIVPVYFGAALALVVHFEQAQKETDKNSN